MRLTHVNITLPSGCEEKARAFYRDLLGLTEIPKPEMMRHRGGCWFDAGGLNIHLSVEENRGERDAKRHFGLDCEDVDAMREKLTKAGYEPLDASPAPWKRFYVHDPFGNMIEIHDLDGPRG
jgi:catechol 2,3-dioxygenase-like lactoylglutathione lyase family enzyme